MTDSITRGDVQRISNRFVPDVMADVDEIERHLENNFDAFNQRAISEFADRIAEQRKRIGGKKYDMKRYQKAQRRLDKMTVLREYETEEGKKEVAFLRNKKGEIIGKRSDFEIEVDDEGNLRAVRKYDLGTL